MRELLGDLDAGAGRASGSAVARVVDIDGSGPRLPGAAMAVADDGEVVGSVSGGCVEGAVVEVALAAIEPAASARCTRSATATTRPSPSGLTCGGTIHLFVEPLDW